MKDYLILYEGCWDSVSADVYTVNSLEELFIRFADDWGENHKTFEKAMSAMETIDEYMEVWNRFSNTRIVGIYEINKIVYED